MSATVEVSGTSVTLRVSNLTSGKSFAKTLKMSAPSISSAEWIAEAPSAVTPGGTQVLPLTNFGKVSFSKATATSTRGHTGSISDAAWSATKIQLVSRAGGGFPGPYGRFVSEQVGSTTATPSNLSAGGEAFTVTWAGNAALATPSNGV